MKCLYSNLHQQNTKRVLVGRSCLELNYIETYLKSFTFRLNRINIIAILLPSYGTIITVDFINNEDTRKHTINVIVDLWHQKSTLLEILDYYNHICYCKPPHLMAKIFNIFGLILEVIKFNILNAKNIKIKVISCAEIQYWEIQVPSKVTVAIIHS